MAEFMKAKWPKMGIITDGESDTLGTPIVFMSAGGKIALSTEMAWSLTVIGLLIVLDGFKMDSLKNLNTIKFIDNLIF